MLRVQGPTESAEEAIESLLTNGVTVLSVLNFENCKGKGQGKLLTRCLQSGLVLYCTVLKSARFFLFSSFGLNQTDFI